MAENQYLLGPRHFLLPLIFTAFLKEIFFGGGWGYSPSILSAFEGVQGAKAPAKIFETMNAEEAFLDSYF